MRFSTLSLLPGCGAALAMLKTPIVDICKDAHLEGCDALAEGTLTYLSGDHDLGRRQIATGAAKNAPKDVLLFAVSLRTVASLPGAGDYKDQLEEIASILQDTAPAATPGAASKAHRDPDKTNPTATTSPTPATLHAGTASFRNAKTCTTVLGASICAKGVQGPATVTTVFAPGGGSRGHERVCRRRRRSLVVDDDARLVGRLAHEDHAPHRRRRGASFRGAGGRE